MTDTKEGYVYILTNPSFRQDWVKIGKSTRPVNVRSRELDNTAVPLPFEIYATLKTNDCAKVERHIHKEIERFTNLRIRKNREFFNVSPEKALEIFRDVVDIRGEGEIVLYKDNKPIISDEPRPKPVVASVTAPVEPVKAVSEPQSQRKKPLPNFRFSMIGVGVGETVTFIPTGQNVRVASDNEVEYDGQRYKLTTFTKRFLPADRRNRKNAYRGPDYFSYKGRVLTDVRKECEMADVETYVAPPAPVATVVSEPPTAVDEEPKAGRKKPRSRFRFSMIGIVPGDIVTFIPAGMQVRVANDSEVEYGSRRYKLSVFTREFMPADRANASGAYQGPKYFSFKGRVLDDLRAEKELRDSENG